jgi:2-polyprenyl-3-methyl-5-hydroxy-6-metoxy-1,4-benzoquinol methylase
MTRCFECGAAARERVLEAVRAARRIELFRCLACDLIYLGSWEEELSRPHYDYYVERLGAKREERYRPINTRRHRAVLAALARQAPGRPLLDVGCGEGHFVHTAIAEGWSARGIDTSAPAIVLCRRFGVPADRIDFFSSDLDEERFDVIVMSEMIEHVPRPGLFLSRAAELLVRGGILYLTTPNFGALTRRVLGSAWPPIDPKHIAYFHRRTLEKLVEKTGAFDIASIEARNLAIGALLARLSSSSRPSPPRTSNEPPRGGNADPDRGRSIDQSIRAHAERSRARGLARDALNAALSLTGLGETLILVARRRPRAIGS